MTLLSVALQNEPPPPSLLVTLFHFSSRVHALELITSREMFSTPTPPRAGLNTYVRVFFLRGGGDRVVEMGSGSVAMTTCCILAHASTSCLPEVCCFHGNVQIGALCLFDDGSQELHKLLKPHGEEDGEKAQEQERERKQEMANENMQRSTLQPFLA